MEAGGEVCWFSLSRFCIAIYYSYVTLMPILLFSPLTRELTCAGGRLPFALSLGGYSGNLVVHEVPPVLRPSPVSSLLPWIPVREKCSPAIIFF